MLASAAFAFVAFSFSSTFSFCGVWLQLSKIYFVTSPPPAFGFSLVRPSCSVVPDLLGASQTTSFVMVFAINDPLSLPYYHFDTGSSSAESL